MPTPGTLVTETVDIPVPGPGEVVVAVKRCGLCGSDIAIYHGDHPYAKSPLVMGHEFSGTVHKVGKGVSNLTPGPRVTIIPHVVCGACRACGTKTYNFCRDLKCMGAEADGAHAEFVAVSAEMALPMPAGMTFDDAALIEPACVGYHGARRGEIHVGDTALILGAGPIGNFTMQSCRALGAARVFVADLDASRLALAERLGADGTIDTSSESLEDGLARLAGGNEEVDVFYDCVGGRGEVLDTIIRLARRGSRVVVIGVLQNGYSIPHLPDFVQHELRLSGTTMYVPQDFRDMLKLIEKGMISTEGLITHHFRLDETQSVFDFVEARKERFFKIMLDVSD